MTHWDIDLMNRDGNVVHNRGVSIINAKLGKACSVIDCILILVASSDLHGRNSESKPIILRHNQHRAY